jgi:CheY-like chemotaxis protein
MHERCWQAIIVDHALGGSLCEQLAEASENIVRRIVLITPAERHTLPELKRAGFTGYLVKPVRRSSLAARMSTAADGFERAGVDSAERDGADAAASGRGGLGLSVLIAEDNEINALLAQALIERLGHRPALATNGDAAQAAGQPYDLVLMDVHMPGSDGLAATRRVRALEVKHGFARTPIVALTANAFDEDRDACLAAGMDAFLVKPLDRELLQAVLATAAAQARIAA